MVKKLNFKLGAVAAIAVGVGSIQASALKFQVATAAGEAKKSYQTTGVLLAESGVCVIGLPNDVTIQGISLVADDGTVGVQSELISYDAYARYAFIKVAPESVKGMAVTQLAPQFPELEAYLAGAKQKFLVAGQVGTHNGKVIPFSFYRLHNAEFTKPELKFPFVKNADGKVVGMVHSKVPNANGAIYSVPASLIQKGLDDIKTFGVPTRAWVGVTLDANVGLPVVKSVRPTSAAAVAGIQKGDIITAIDGVKVKNYDATVKAMYLLKALKPVEFEVVRGERRMKVKFAPKKFPTSR